MKRTVIFLAMLLGLAVVARADPTTEIEGLLSYVGSLQGAKFIRNGSEHTPDEAVAHLRLKWKNQAGAIATAEDFIRLCGTKSSLSGQPYVIRFADGRAEECALVLARQLRTLRTAKPAH